jgi:hypothetical protein
MSLLKKIKTAGAQAPKRCSTKARLTSKHHAEEHSDCQHALLSLRVEQYLALHAGCIGMDVCKSSKCITWWAHMVLCKHMLQPFWKLVPASLAAT